MTLKSFFISAIGILTLLATPPSHAAKTSKFFKLKVTLVSGVNQVYAISKKGRVFSPTVSGKNNTISIPNADVAGASLYAVSSEGQTLGPVYAKEGAKALLFFAKSPKDNKKKILSSLTLKLQTIGSGQNFVFIKSVPKGSIFDKKYEYVALSTPQFGQNALKSSSRSKVGKLAAASQDADGDGVVNRLDVDADGDGIPNTADSSTDIAGSSIGKKDAERVDVPYAAMYLDMGRSINWHIGGSLSQTQIDAAIGGENIFSIAFFFTPPTGTDSTAINGGHVICDSSLVYCKPTVGSDTGTAIYSGFSEGDQTLTGRLWSSINTDGSAYSLERFSVGGSSAIAASFQPRVGSAQFRPGDNYRVDFTNSSGAVISSTSLTLPPYFLTVPVIRAFNTASNSSDADTLVTYGTSGPGSNQSNPIELSSSGDFVGKLRLSVYRLQRLATDDERTTLGSDYLDFGHLNYGVNINNNSGEYTCGGLYESISSTLTEVPSTGSSGSFLTREGATLWPLVDGSDDYAPSNSSDSSIVGNNTISFTVNLKECLARNGLSSGIHQVNLFASGQDTGHGSNRAAQMFYVSIP